MRRSRARATVVWLAFMIAGIAIVAQASFSADLSAFLPRAPTERPRLLIDQLRDGIAARLLLVGIEGGDAAARADASRQLASALRASGQFDAIENGDEGTQADTGQRLFDHRYLLSAGVDAERFSEAGLRAAIDDTIGLLASPVGSRLKSVFARDPTGEIIALATSLQPAGSPLTSDGVWASRDGQSALLLAHAHAAGADLDALSGAVAAVHSAFDSLGRSDLRLALSGSAVFAIEARAQMKHEVVRIAALGAVLILLLLGVAFASASAIALSMAPVLTGVLAGIVAVALGFGTVHGITLGFGTTLIGEAVDYAIYYLIQSRHRDAQGDGAMHWIRHSWPTVRIGLATSVCGFGVLAFSGFPGLAQLGLFTVGGLSAAALVTRYGLTAWAPNGAASSGLRDRLGDAARVAMRVLQRARLLVLAVALISVAGIAIGGRALWSGDIADLSPASAAARELDARLRGDLGSAAAAQLITIEASDADTALLAAETIGAQLDARIGRGEIAGYDSPARYLPSRSTQAARRAALPPADELRTRLAAATQGSAVAAARLEPFIADVASARTAAPIERSLWTGTSISVALDALLLERPDAEPASRWLAMINVHPASGGAAIAAESMAARIPLDAPAGVRAGWLDIKTELDSLYAHYLDQALWQALLGSLAVVIVIGLHLRSVPRTLAAVLPLAAAVAVTLALLAVTRKPLDILHMVGLLLVVAVGSNYSLFFADRQAHDRDTAASLVLANTTTVLSFALIAFSDVATLAAIGRTVAPGAALALLFSAAMAPRDALDAVGESAP
ncbi:MMPL family transporter [soil metagenome]